MVCTAMPYPSCIVAHTSLLLPQSRSELRQKVTDELVRARVSRWQRVFPQVTLNLKFTEVGVCAIQRECGVDVFPEFHQCLDV